jgi:hypothetical protein
MSGLRGGDWARWVQLQHSSGILARPIIPTTSQERKHRLWLLLTDHCGFSLILCDSVDPYVPSTCHRIWMKSPLNTMSLSLGQVMRNPAWRGRLAS